MDVQGEKIRDEILTTINIQHKQLKMITSRVLQLPIRQKTTPGSNLAILTR